MSEILIPQRRPRGIIIISLLLTLQSICWLALTVFIAVLGIITVRSAVAKHKFTAASLTTAFATLGGAFFLIISLLALVFAWAMWRQKSWSYLVSVILEVLLVLICLASLCNGIIWPLLAQGVLAAVILAFICINREVRAIAE